MAFTYAPDFVVKRRRNRSRQLAIDPCLGFYEDRPTSPLVSVQVPGTPCRTLCSSKPIVGTHIVKQNRLDDPVGHRNNDIDVFEGLPGDASTSCARSGVQTSARVEDVDMPLTVEEFLRRAATSTKRYTTRRRKKPEQPRTDDLFSTGGDSFVDSDPHDPDYRPEDSSSSPLLSSKRRGHRIVWTSDEEDDETPEKPPKKRRRRQKKTQPLSARLLAAAVVTGVDVVGGILLPDTTTGPPDAQGRRILKARRPLPFVPDNRAPSPEEKFKTGRRHFVDPRKAAPFKNAHCEFARPIPIGANGRALIGKKASRPITAWKPVAGDAGSRTGCSPGNAPPRNAPRVSTTRLVTVPLKLVPVSVDDSNERLRGRPAHARTEARHGRDAAALPLVPCTRLSPPRQRAPARVLHFKEESSFFIPNSSPAEPIPACESICPSPSSASASAPDNLARTHLELHETAPIEDEAAQSQVTTSIDGVDGQDDGDDGQDSTTRSQLDRLGPSRDIVSPEASLLPQPLVAPVPDTSQAITLTRSAPRRPLKSLVSMLDNFRTIARSATQKPPMASQSRSRPHTARSIVPPPNQQARPLSALPSDDSFSLRRLRERVTGAASMWSGAAE